MNSVSVSVGTAVKVSELRKLVGSCSTKLFDSASENKNVDEFFWYSLLKKETMLRNVQDVFMIDELQTSLSLSLSRQVLQNNNIYFRRKSRVRVLRKLDH